MAIVFVQVPGQPLYDLHVDGRAAAYDVEPEEFAETLRRRRITPTRENPVYVEDETGYRKRLG